MKAFLFGSISVLADTSELQRLAFNTAFKEAGLDWDWGQSEYQKLLISSGGKDRIAAQAAERGEEVDAPTIHARKSEIFQDALRSGDFDIRPVTAQMMEFAKTAGIETAFITTTSRHNIDALLQGYGGAEGLGLSLVTSADDVPASKPDPAIYAHALEKLGMTAQDVIAIEDNVPGRDAAEAAGITCLVYPNQNTAEHDFGASPKAEDWQVHAAP